MDSFPTGSRVYGTPRPDSDYDFVVLADVDHVAYLVAVADECRGVKDNEVKSGQQTEEDPEVVCECSLKFGNVNFIVVTDPVQFEVWKSCTEFLKTKAPVDRERAKAYIKKKLKQKEEEELF